MTLRFLEDVHGLKLRACAVPGRMVIRREAHGAVSNLDEERKTVALGHLGATPFREIPTPTVGPERDVAIMSIEELRNRALLRCNQDRNERVYVSGGRVSD